jgi:hypothetical protein
LPNKMNQCCQAKFNEQILVLLNQETELLKSRR